MPSSTEPCARTLDSIQCGVPRQPRGMLAGLFLRLYAVVRVVVENFREPDAPLTGPFTRGQTLSGLLIAGGICFIVYARKTRDYEAGQRD